MQEYFYKFKEEEDGTLHAVLKEETGGGIVRIEYASNDNNKTDLTTTYCVNTPNGSKGLRSTSSSLDTIVKRIEFPTPYNAETDRITLEIKDSEGVWRSLSDSESVLTDSGGTVNSWAHIINANGNIVSRGVTLRGDVSGTFCLAYGQYRLLSLQTTVSSGYKWEAYTSDWYWRAKKTTFAYNPQ